MTKPLSGENNPNNQNVTIPLATLQAMQDDIDYLKEAIEVLSGGIVSFGRYQKAIQNDAYAAELVKAIKKHRSVPPNRTIATLKEDIEKGI